VRSHRYTKRDEEGKRLMTHVLLVGGDVALLEGLAQSLAAQGHAPAVSTSLAEARDLAMSDPPLALVVNRALASSSGAELLAIPLAAGGARILYRAATIPLAPLLPALQRSVLADLTLPLERHRLSALVKSLGERARATGRDLPRAPGETERGSRGELR
jgi:DNA-binding NtrC family response regulator